MTLLRTSLFTAAASLCLLGTAAADPGVVVLSFDGEMNLAVAARAEIVALIDQDYDVVTQRAWREALENDGRPGKAAWKQAAKQTKVAAVIEGSAIKVGRGGTLKLTVRDATTGRTIEQLSAPLGKNGLTEAARAELEMSLTDALFATGDSVREADSVLTEDDEAPSKPRPRVAADVKVGMAASHSGAEPERLALFEAPRTDGSSAPTIVKEAPVLPRNPIADLTLTGSAISRQFGFTGMDLPAEYPGTTVTSIGLTAAIYPTSKRDSRGRLNGLGVAATIMTSVASEVPVDLDGEIFDFPVSQDAWQINAHYRYPAGAAITTS